MNLETFFNYICAHAHHAHWIIFLLLLLTAFNLPISEDILSIIGGAIASTCIPDHAVQLYVWIFLGCYLSAWIAYWIGRLLGPKLYAIRLFRSVVTQHRLRLLRDYYRKYGVFTFIVGRFCPGGIRNALFLSSGLTKMPFHLFILRDGFACLLSSFVFFSIGYHFAANHEHILALFHKYTHWFLTLFIGLCIALFLFYWRRKRRNG